MGDVVGLAIKRLRKAGVRLAPGLSDAEMDGVQSRLGFNFCASHRRLLSSALPRGTPDSSSDRWPDWRSGADEDLRRRLTWPVDGVVFDVLHNGFWAASWGARPEGADAAEAKARKLLDAVPRMVPIYGHRYLPAEPGPEDPPVFSIYQTDVIYYGDDLLDYVAHEFHVPPRHPSPITDNRRTPFWSDLAEGAEPEDL